MKAKIEAIEKHGHKIDPKPGDVFWVGGTLRDLTMVVRTGVGLYQVVRLSDGNRWCDPLTIGELVEWLEQKNPTPANVKIVNA